ncbi:MAG: hypothetical protein ACOX5J_08530 [Candidatus Hydrogenedentales bacterium]|jgi:hypothetical protein
MADKTKKQEKFSLPTSGYDTLTKILHAYALVGDREVTLNTIAQKSGIGRTGVSPNHPFLTTLGILQGGRKKRVSLDGKSLVVAISQELDSDIAANWRSVLEKHPQTKSVIDMIRVQKKAIPADELRKRIASTIGLAQSKLTTTGANCLIEILQRSGLLEESNGAYIFNEGTQDVSPIDGERRDPAGKKEAQAQVKKQQTADMPPAKAKDYPAVHIDIQIHIAADAKPEQIDQIFTSMAKHLYGKE